MKKTSMVFSGMLMLTVLAGAGCAANTNVTTQTTAETPAGTVTNTTDTQADTHETGDVDVHVEGEGSVEVKTEKPMGGMKAVTPPALTVDQTTQLQLGAGAHQPAKLTFDVHGGSFYYVPNVIKVKKGDTVTINFVNDGGFHDFTLDEFNVKIGPTNGGETTSVTFTADKVGEFEYYCSVGRHREMGQKGKLIVE